MSSAKPAHVVVRAVWYLLAIVSLAVLLLSVSAYPAPLEFGPIERTQLPAPLIGAMTVLLSLGSLAVASLCLALAGLLFWRSAGDRMAQFVSFYLLAYGILAAGPVETLAAQFPGARGLAVAGQAAILTPLTVALIGLFPNGRFVPRWTRWLVPASLLPAALAPFYLVPPFEELISGAPPAVMATALILTIPAVALYGQRVRYRTYSTPSERQQAKWILLGFAAQFTLVVVSSVPYGIALNLPPGAAIPWWMPAASVVWLGVIAIFPVTLTVALTRYRLWDVDLFINRALVYSVLTIALALLYLTGVAVLQNALRVVTGQADQLAIVATTLAIAAAFSPLRARVQGTIDRRFYRRRYDATRALAAFSGTVRDEVDLTRMQAELLDTVEQTMHPSYVSLWLRSEAGRPVEER